MGKTFKKNNQPKKKNQHKTVQICYPTEPISLKHLVQLLVISRWQTEMLFNKINYDNTENYLKYP